MSMATEAPYKEIELGWLGDYPGGWCWVTCSKGIWYRFKTIGNQGDRDDKERHHLDNLGIVIRVGI